MFSFSLVKSPFAEGLAHVYQTAHFMLQVHLHQRANGCCKNQVSGREDVILVSGRMRPSEDTISVGDHLDLFNQFKNDMPFKINQSFSSLAFFIVGLRNFDIFLNSWKGKDQEVDIFSIYLFFCEYILFSPFPMIYTF